MAEMWFASDGGKLVFVYRAKNWSISPPRFMNSTELTAVLAEAFDESGSALTVAQQPSYNANLGGYAGWILASDIANKGFATIRFTPTLGPGLPAEWGQVKTADVRVDHQLRQALASVTTADVEFDAPILPQGG